jgi:hypothetical protein
LVLLKVQRCVRLVLELLHQVLGQIYYHGFEELVLDMLASQSDKEWLC